MTPARIEALLAACFALPDFQPEKAALEIGLRPQFFAGAKNQNRYRSAKSYPYWEAVEKWLATKGVQVAAEQVEDAKVAGEFDKAVDAADTPEKCNLLINRVIKAMHRGDIDVAKGNALIAGINAKRQLLKSMAEEQEKARAGEPLIVRVTYVNSWREQTGEEGDAQ